MGEGERAKRTQKMRKIFSGENSSVVLLLSFFCCNSDDGRRRRRRRRRRRSAIASLLQGEKGRRERKGRAVAKVKQEKELLLLLLFSPFPLSLSWKKEESFRSHGKVPLFPESSSSYIIRKSRL